MKKEDLLLAYLKANCAGHRNIRTRAQLQRTLGLHKNQLTDLVHKLRCRGEPVAGGPGGYYYAQNAAELDATVRWLEKIIQTLLKSVSGLRKAMESFGPIGAPAEAQRSGFGGERRSDGAGEFSPSGGNERAQSATTRGDSP